MSGEIANDFAEMIPPSVENENEIQYNANSANEVELLKDKLILSAKMGQELLLRLEGVQNELESLREETWLLQSEKEYYEKQSDDLTEQLMILRHENVTLFIQDSANGFDTKSADQTKLVDMYTALIAEKDLAISKQQADIESLREENISLIERLLEVQLEIEANTKRNHTVSDTANNNNSDIQTSLSVDSSGNTGSQPLLEHGESRSRDDIIVTESFNFGDPGGESHHPATTSASTAAIKELLTELETLKSEAVTKDKIINLLQEELFLYRSQDPRMDENTRKSLGVYLQTTLAQELLPTIHGDLEGQLKRLTRKRATWKQQIRNQQQQEDNNPFSPPGSNGETDNDDDADVDSETAANTAANAAIAASSSTAPKPAAKWKKRPTTSFGGAVSGGGGGRGVSTSASSGSPALAPALSTTGRPTISPSKSLSLVSGRDRPRAHLNYGTWSAGDVSAGGVSTYSSHRNSSVSTSKELSAANAGTVTPDKDANKNPEITGSGEDSQNDVTFQSSPSLESLYSLQTKYDNLQTHFTEMERRYREEIKSLRDAIRKKPPVTSTSSGGQKGMRGRAQDVSPVEPEVLNRRDSDGDASERYSRRSWWECIAEYICCLKRSGEETRLIPHRSNSSHIN